MSREVNKFILEGEEIEFADDVARDGISALEDRSIPAGGTDGQVLTKDGSTNYATKWASSPGGAQIDDNEISTNKVWSSSKVSSEDSNLQTQINNKATIDDNDITTSKTWSSSKINSEIQGGGGGGGNVPAGGTTGQILAKNSNLDYDTHWINEPSPGAVIDDTTTSTDTTWSSSKIGSEIVGLIDDTSSTALDKTWSAKLIYDSIPWDTYDNTVVSITVGNQTTGLTVRKYNSVVYLQATITPSVTVSSGSHILGTLPEIYRPKYGIMLPIYFGTSSPFSVSIDFLSIRSNGEIILYTPGHSNNFASIATNYSID